MDIYPGQVTYFTFTDEDGFKVDPPPVPTGFFTDYANSDGCAINISDACALGTLYLAPDTCTPCDKTRSIIPLTTEHLCYTFAYVHRIYHLYTLYLENKTWHLENHTPPVAEESARQRNVDGAKRAVLDKAVGDILKRYGDGSIMRLGEAQAHGDRSHTPPAPCPSILPSAWAAFHADVSPRSIGPESSGKTTLCQHIVAEAQKMGGIAAFIDMEHALDPVYAARVGVDIDNLLVSQPDTGEQALEITETLVRSGGVDVVVMNSVAALVPAPRSKAIWAMPPWACRPA